MTKSKYIVQEHVGGRIGERKSPRTRKYNTEEEALLAMAKAKAAGNVVTCTVQHCTVRAKAEFAGVPLCGRHYKRAELVESDVTVVHGTTGQELEVWRGPVVTLRPTVSQWRNAPASVRHKQGALHPVTNELTRHAVTVDGFWVRWWEKL